MPPRQSPQKRLEDFRRQMKRAGVKAAEDPKEFLEFLIGSDDDYNGMKQLAMKLLDDDQGKTLEPGASNEAPAHVSGKRSRPFVDTPGPSKKEKTGSVFDWNKVIKSRWPDQDREQSSGAPDKPEDIHNEEVYEELADWYIKTGAANQTVTHLEMGDQKIDITDIWGRVSGCKGKTKSELIKYLKDNPLVFDDLSLLKHQYGFFDGRSLRRARR